ncbi:MAG: WD40 repeat domain-containing protein [Sulfurospirillaceae bacterium]|nr:WD40 repeat domain-containing protein [Sulfurospirillaceae bacterium]
MKKYFLFFLFFLVVLQAKELTPSYTLKVNGDIVDMMISSGKIYVTTDSSSVDIFDIATKKLEKVIKFKKIKDFLGELSDVRIYSVDKDKDRLLFVTQGEKGYSRIYLYQEGVNKLLLDENSEMSIMKAMFLSGNKIIFATLSSQVVVYDMKNKKIVYNKQISESKFSDFVLNIMKTKLLLADESGDTKLVDVSDGSIEKVFKGKNLDNVYQIDYKDHVIATAGKDRRCAVYWDNNSHSYYKSSNFLIYSVGLSPFGKLCAYASDDKNNIVVFETQNGEDLYKLSGNESPISNIVFADKNSLFTTNKNKIKFWKLFN